MSGIAVLVTAAGVTVGVLAVAVWAALAGHVWGAVVAGVVALPLMLTTGAWVLLLRDQYRDPPRYDFVLALLGQFFRGQRLPKAKSRGFGLAIIRLSGPETLGRHTAFSGKARHRRFWAVVFGAQSSGRLS